MTTPTITYHQFSVADDPLREPRGATVRDRGRRAVILTLLTLLVPGSAQIAAGSRRIGRIGLAVTVGCWFTLLLGALMFFTLRGPLLSALTGEDFRMKALCAPLAEDFPKTSPGPRYVRANLKDGKLYVPQSHSSGQLLTLSGCDHLLKIPAGDKPLPAGTVVEAYRI